MNRRANLRPKKSRHKCAGLFKGKSGEGQGWLYAILFHDARAHLVVSRTTLLCFFLGSAVVFFDDVPEITSLRRTAPATPFLCDLRTNVRRACKVSRSRGSPMFRAKITHVLVAFERHPIAASLLCRDISFRRRCELDSEQWIIPLDFLLDPLVPLQESRLLACGPGT
ncbi:hypothetical protein KNO81_34430 [Paraburkholderia sediminicola]|nr:hypothetical protein [Paraburkholderia sediminicola]